MNKSNIEIQNAQQAIKLLKSYSVAETQAEKDELLKQLEAVDRLTYLHLIKRGYDPLDLAQKMEKAIKLDKYRPKNLPIVKLALNKDLDYINGDFDTFDYNINKMIRNNEKPENIRDRFKAATVNVYVLAKQFSKDWIRRLNNHKDLADAARNADEKTAVDAYDKLFEALTKDFCEDNNCYINSKVITDWATSDVKPKDGWDETNGYQKPGHGLDLPKNISKEEKTKVLEEFRKNPEEYPGARRESWVRLNITNIRKKHPEPTDFFYTMISIFAHEIHHALDYQQPRKGALGPQIYRIDAQTYTNPTKDANAYSASATEISSHTIQDELFKQLKNTRF